MTRRTIADVLSFIPHYLPGYKAGGPVRALVNLVERVGEEFRFNIVTTDRDQGDSDAYKEAVVNQWVKVGKADVKYLSPRHQSFKEIRKLFQEFPSSITYITGLFSTTFSAKILILIRLRLIQPKVVIIAPRGELCSEALNNKHTKKVLYLYITKFFGFYNRIVWQASTFQERLEIEHVFGSDSCIKVAVDLVDPSFRMGTAGVKRLRYVKKTGALRIISLSRIVENKNLYGALQMLRDLDGDIVFNIYGPIQDQDYWKDCQRYISLLPANIEVSYLGAVLPDKVQTTFEGYDLFLFPTNYESFGHVVIESLLAGCPVLISDRTPWIDLEERRAGWVVKYSDIERFRETLGRIVDMGPEEYAVYSDNAIKYANTIIDDPTAVDDYRRLFEHRH